VRGQAGSMNKPRLSLVVGVVVVVALAAGAVWWFQRPQPPATLTLYGNVDLRQVSLAFNANERVAQMRASEGDHVARGEVLAVLDTVSLKLRIARAEAQTSAQEQVLERLKAGSRAEEIAQSRGSVAAAQAEAAKADDQYERLRSINQNTGGRGISRQDLDAARAARAVAQAQLENARKAMQLVVAGPRGAGLLLGLVGLAALVALGFPGALAAVGGGLVERLAVYPITAWELIAGLSLLRSARSAT